MDVTSTVGDPADPPIVLIPGPGAATDWWQPEFCRRLAEGRRFVVCYEHLVAEPRPDRVPDLAEDAVSTLDSLGIGAAHLVGAGLGGAIAQQVALAHPDRVATLTLVDAPPLPGLAGDLGSTPLVLHDANSQPVSLDLAVPILKHTAGSWAQQADRLARVSYQDGSPTGWFDRLYAQAEAGSVTMPWNRTEPHPLLAGWVFDHGLAGSGQRAIVVGSGLGADAEFMSRLGFTTTAFDISDAAIRLARGRFPDSTVDYHQADLLHLPAEWRGAFDVVVDVFTVQALPDPPRATAIEAVASLVAPGGRLVAVAAARDEDTDVQGPPWPLTASEIHAYATGGLVVSRISQVPDPSADDTPRWLGEFTRPADVQ